MIRVHAAPERNIRNAVGKSKKWAVSGEEGIL